MSRGMKDGAGVLAAALLSGLSPSSSVLAQAIVRPAPITPAPVIPAPPLAAPTFPAPTPGLATPPALVLPPPVQAPPPNASWSRPPVRADGCDCRCADGRCPDQHGVCPSGQAMANRTSCQP